MSVYNTILCLQAFETWVREYIFKRGCTPQFHYEADHIQVTLNRRSDNGRIGGISIYIDDFNSVEQLKEIFEYEFNKIIVSCFKQQLCNNHRSYNGFRGAYKNIVSVPAIKNVVFNDPATIVIWADGTKTVVKTQNGEEFDPEKGLAMAITKKALGNQGNYYETIKKWVEKYEPAVTADKIIPGVKMPKDMILGSIVANTAQEAGEKLDDIREALAKCGLALTDLRKEGSE